MRVQAGKPDGCGTARRDRADSGRHGRWPSDARTALRGNGHRHRSAQEGARRHDTSCSDPPWLYRAAGNKKPADMLYRFGWCVNSIETKLALTRAPRRLATSI